MSFSISAFYRILKRAGAKRVSDSAAKALKEIIEERAEELARQAVRVAEHANRRTVMARDIELVTGEKK